MSLATVPERSESALIGPEGGTLALQAPDGDRVTLTVPPGALALEMPVTLVPFSDDAVGPFSQGVVAEVRSLPTNLHVQEAATLSVANGCNPLTAEDTLLAAQLAVIHTDVVRPVLTRAETDDRVFAAAVEAYYCWTAGTRSCSGSTHTSSPGSSRTRSPPPSTP
jgi:hypothetical protein